MCCPRFHDKVHLALATVAGVCVLMLSCKTQPAPRKTQPQYDLLIKGGHILDGTGSTWYKGDVAVKDGRIAMIRRLVNPSAWRLIGATGFRDG